MKINQLIANLLKVLPDSTPIPVMVDGEMQINDIHIPGAGFIGVGFVKDNLPTYISDYIEFESMNDRAIIHVPTLSTMYPYTEAMEMLKLTSISIDSPFTLLSELINDDSHTPELRITPDDMAIHSEYRSSEDDGAPQRSASLTINNEAYLHFLNGKLDIDFDFNDLEIVPFSVIDGRNKPAKIFTDGVINQDNFIFDIRLAVALAGDLTAMTTDYTFEGSPKDTVQLLNSMFHHVAGYSLTSSELDLNYNLAAVGASALIKGLTELNEQPSGLSIQMIRDNYTAEKMTELALNDALSDTAKTGIADFLKLVNWVQDKPVNEQSNFFHDEFKILTAYYNLALERLIDIVENDPLADLSAGPSM